MRSWCLACERSTLVDDLADAIADLETAKRDLETAKHEADARYAREDIARATVCIDELLAEIARIDAEV